MEVTTIKHDEFVFCFGSNIAGRHGKGAALTAKMYFGAEEGVGEGLCGNTYAIPTKDRKIQTLAIGDIRYYIDRFLAFAAQAPHKRFMVTRIGCGYAGYSDDQIAPLFYDRGVPDNVFLPGMWQATYGAILLPKRVIIAGGRDFKDYARLSDKCARLLSRFDCVEVVSGGAKGADELGEQFCCDMVNRGFDYRLTRFPAAWDAYGKAAGRLRNAAMAQYSQYLLAFWDGQSPGTRHMIETAENDRLERRVIRYEKPAF